MVKQAWAYASNCFPRLMVFGSKIVITLFFLFAEPERGIISLRTKKALTAEHMQGSFMPG